MYEVAILEMSADDLGRMRPLLEASPFKPYRFLCENSRQELGSFWLDTVAEQSRSGSVAACLRGGRIVGLAVLSELTWESNAIGRRIWGIQQLVVAPGEPDGREILDLLVARILTLAADHGGDAVHCKRLTDDVAACQTLERRGFHLVDTQLVYGYRTRGIRRGRSSDDYEADGLNLRLADREDLEELVKVARACFKNHFGRFHSDHRLPPGAAASVYEEWIRSSLSGYADYVLLAEVDGRVAACSIWRKPSAREANLLTRVGHYSLGAVHPDFQHRGLFTEVTRRGTDLLEGVADLVVGPTHVNNYGVQRGWGRLGWQIVDATHTFHVWLR